MRKNPHDRILKEKSKEQHLSTVPKSCSIRNNKNIQNLFMHHKK